MKDNKKSRSRVQPQAGQEQKGVATFMSLPHFITKCRRSKAYFRGLVVRAIEDAIIYIILGVGIWVICIAVGGFFRLLGVGA